MITNAELWALNGLEVNIKQADDELQRRVEARNAYMALLEGKYNAKFDPQTREFIPNDGAKEEVKAGLKNNVGRKQP